MQSPATTAATTQSSTPFITPTATPATSYGQNEQENAPHRLPTKPPALAQDFYIDTFFNHVWMSGPHVFSFAEDGTVVRPETCAREPYPGYHADRTRRLESVRASHFQGFAKRDTKIWKNVATTEQDDAEWEAAMQERARIGAVGEWGRCPPCGPAIARTTSMHQQPELVYTWPPKPHGW